MIALNLLRVRAQKHTFQAYAFKNMFLVVLLALASILICHLILTNRVEKLRIKTIQLKNIVAKQDQGEKLTNHNSFLEKFSALIETRRWFIVDLLQQLEIIANTRSCFTEVVEHTNKIKLIGTSVSLKQIETVLTEWQRSQDFSEVKINKVEQQHQAVQFYAYALEKDFFPTILPSREHRHVL